jgi:hypothetical protein
MAGSPIKRMRKAGITDPVTGELVAFHSMLRVAELPPGWRWFSTAEKVEHLLGMSPDRAAEILIWRRSNPRPFRPSRSANSWKISFATARTRARAS